MKVLLVVDMQKGFINADKYSLLNKNISDLVSKNIYDKYIFTQYINDKNKNPFYQAELGWNSLTTKKEQEISVEMPQNSIIIKKYGYGLSNNDLNYIKSLNISEIDICGIKAEACVYAIALQLWDNKIYPNILLNYTDGDVDMKNIYLKQFGAIK